MIALREGCFFQGTLERVLGRRRGIKRERKVERHVDCHQPGRHSLAHVAGDVFEMTHATVAGDDDDEETVVSIRH